MPHIHGHTQHQKDCTLVERGIMAMLEQRGGGLTFVNLEVIPGFSGPFTMELGERNIFFWQHVSAAAIAAIQAMKDAGLIDLKTTSLLTYLIDGKRLNLPVVGSGCLDRIAKSKAFSYKSPRWLPMAIYRGKNYPRPAAGSGKQNDGGGE